MDSGTLQSSSGGDGGGGGDDVYDSRTESTFLNPSTQFNPLPNLQPPPSSSSHQQPSNYFDPSTFSKPPNPNPDPMYNLDSLCYRNPNPNSIYNHDPQQDSYINPNPVDDNINAGIGPGKVGVTTKNPKKRTRASRRAPTTVLTTDTTNFRQMVQEFTGGGIAPLLPLRPSAHKIHLQQPSCLNSSTNFHLPPSERHGFTKQPLNLSNLTNQMFPFQSLSQTQLPQQTDATERENQRSEPSNAIPNSSTTSLKRWTCEDGNLLDFEGANGHTKTAVVSSTSDDDQLPGNEDSWICRSD